MSIKKNLGLIPSNDLTDKDKQISIQDTYIFLYSYAKYLTQHLKKYLQNIKIEKNELRLKISIDFLPIVIYYLKNHIYCQYKVFVDLIGIDFPYKKNRFSLLYNLLSITFNSRIIVEISITEFTNVPSITKIYKAATWFEREVWDMFGIYFYNNIDFRRILTDYGFKGYPLRKDFPLTGFVEVYYDKTKRRILYGPLKLAQEYRRFDFTKPWDFLIKTNI